MVELLVSKPLNVPHATFEVVGSEPPCYIGMRILPSFREWYTSTYHTKRFNTLDH